MLIKNDVGTQVRGYKYIYIYILKLFRDYFVLTQVEGKDFFFLKRLKVKRWSLISLGIELFFL